jgi:hypothetical protein
LSGCRRKGLLITRNIVDKPDIYIQSRALRDLIHEGPMQRFNFS